MAGPEILGGADPAAAYRAEAASRVEPVQRAGADALATKERVGRELHASSNGTFNLLRVGALGLTALAMLLGAAVGFFVARSVVGRVRIVERTVTSLADNCAVWLAEGLGAMASGDLTVGFTPVTPPIEQARARRDRPHGRRDQPAAERIIASLARYDEARSGLAALIGQVQSSAARRHRRERADLDRDPGDRRGRA